MPYSDPDKQRAADLAYYHRNRDKRRESADSRRRELRAKVAEVKSGTPCTDCGGTFHPVCMDFDHVGSDKVSDVSTLISRRSAWATIEAEIAKCELVCSNCHRLRAMMRLADQV